MLYNSQVVIVGDLYLHLEDPGLPAALYFRTIEEQFALIQHVVEPTHQHDGWLTSLLHAIIACWPISRSPRRRSRIMGWSWQ